MKWYKSVGDGMFIGEYNHTIDNKGRLIMPSKFREYLGDGFVITKGLDNCLFVFPRAQWEKFQDKLNKLPVSSKDARAFSRFFYSGATEAGIDKQGRTLIPQNLRDYGELSKDVTIVGLSTRMEIWDREKWLEYNNDDKISYEEVAEKMESLGI